jgi:putative ABC transport system substrate-binding protein
MRVIGFLSVSNASTDDLTSFRLGLCETGHIEGGNLAIEYHWAEGRYDRLRGLADDLVSRKVEMLVTVGGHFAALAAKNATSTIPIPSSAVTPAGPASSPVSRDQAATSRASAFSPTN